MTEGQPEQRESAADEFGLGAVRELLQMLSETDVTEIEIERGGARLFVKRGASAPPQITMLPAAAAQHIPIAAAPSPAAGAPGAPAHPAGDHEALPPGNIVTAPMVGTFYGAASPKDAPFVSEGDTIHAGDKVGIIEAMKMMNEIESEFAGRVARILVKNGQPVEFGQPLMVIEAL
jgi:acetyl-CoA carboxylase biotin carboxyl carrier protein